MSMFACHRGDYMEVVLAEQVMSPKVDQTADRGENSLKGGTACAKALRYESSSNEASLFAIYAEPKPAAPTPSRTVCSYHAVSSGLNNRAQLVRLLRGSRG